MYFGNFAGVLEYDGTSWRTITTTNYAKVSSLYLDDKGRVFVGANGEFGYLKPDARGTLHFASLSDRITTPFGEIQSIVGTQSGIYFIGKKDIYLWNKKLVRQWHTEDLILSAYFVQGQMYLYQRSRGLGRFDGNKILPVALSSGLPALLDVSAMLSLDAQNILLATSNQGLFKISNNLLTRFAAPANAYLSNNQISTGLRLNDNTFALATLQGGIALVNQEG